MSPMFQKLWRRSTFVFAGVALAVYPYFFDNAWLIALIGIVLVAVPIAIERGMI